MAYKRFLSITFIIAAFLLPSFIPADGYAKTTSQTSSSSKTASKSVKTTSKSTSSSAKKVSSKTIKTSSKSSKSKTPSKSTTSNFSALVVDASNGHVLYDKNSASIRYPASLTKMMTLYMTFDAIERGRLSLDTRMPVSSKAASQPQTNISLDKGDKLPVRAAIESLVVRSANDSAVVLAEAIGGTEWNFALLMTQKARELGMKNTVFRNASGLPDNKQHTTALDMARLAIALRRDFPQYYPFFKMDSFTYNGVTYPGHNHVMEKYAGVDGIKTGYIRASGYNLVTSARRGEDYLVAVIMGGTSITSRDTQMIYLLDRTFTQLETQRKNGVASKRSDAGEASSATLEVMPNMPGNPG